MRIIGWAVLGLLGGGAIVFTLGLLWLDFIVVNDFEGGGAMAVVFVSSPAGAVAGAI
jgi:hypothetical protein